MRIYTQTYHRATGGLCGLVTTLQLCCLEGHQTFPCFITHPLGEEAVFPVYLQSAYSVPGAGEHTGGTRCNLAFWQRGRTNTPEDREQRRREEHLCQNVGYIVKKRMRKQKISVN